MNPEFMKGQFEPTDVILADAKSAISSYGRFVADLDNNGCDDVVSSVYYLNIRYCFNGELQEPLVIGPSGGTALLTPMQTGVVALWDIDENGYKDIILHNAYILNFGYNQFGDAQFFDSNGSIVQFRDYDADGDMDLLFRVYQNTTHTNHLMMNLGMLNFQLVDVQIPNDYIALSDDFNADGAADLVTETGVYFNDGNGNFPTADASLIGLSGYDHRFCANDADSDGYVDFAYYDYETLYIAEYSPTGWSIVVVSVPEITYVTDMQFVLWDQDSIPDIVLIQDTNQEDWIYVATGNADGTYDIPYDVFSQTTPLYGWNGFSVDLDFDGDEDHVQYQNDVLVVYQNENGIMQNYSELTGFGDYFWGTLITDLNGDMLPEIITVDSSDREVIFQNLGNCNFATPFNSDIMMTNFLDMKVTKFTPDEYPDILLLFENAIYLMENQTGNYFFDPVQIAASDRMRSFQFYDLDSDGDLDLFYSKSNGGLWFQRNAGGNSFEPETLLLEPVGEEITTYECDVEFGFGNFLGDSLEDVFCSRITHLGVWPNVQSFAEDLVLTNVDFDFPSDQLFLVNDSLYESTSIYHVAELSIRDFNQDGFLDVANSYYYLQMFFGDGSGNFSIEQLGSTIWDTPLSSGNVDLDSNIECLMNSNYANEIVLAEITNANVMNDEGQSFNGYTGWLIDLNHDGYLDVLSATSTPLLVYAYMNDGTGNFQNYGQYNLPGLSYGEINQLDMDLDSISDLIWLNGFGVMLARGSDETMSSLTVHVYADENENGYNDDEPPLFSVPIITEPPHQSLYTEWNGNVSLAINEGDYIVQCLSPSDLWLVSEYFSDTITSTNQSSLFNIEFGLKPNGVVGDIQFFYLPPSQTCLDTVGSTIFLFNDGNVRGDATITLTLDSHCSLISANPNPTGVSGNTITWQMDSLGYQSSTPIYLQLLYPGIDSIGIELNHEIHIEEYFNELMIFSDSLMIEELISCAYDPNDITENTGFTPAGYVNGVDFLEYTIRFQNTGNAPATTVRIECVLDQFLESNSLVPLASSHDYQLSIDQNNKLIIQFPFINLPDSSSDFGLSQGFFTYRIEPLAGLDAGTEIFAQAEIYFDYNPAITTNEELNTVYSCDDLLESDLVSGVICEGTLIECSNDAIWIDNLSWTFNDAFIGSGVMSFEIEQSGVLNMVADNSLCTVEQEFYLLVDSVNVGITQQQNLLSVDENQTYQWLLNGEEISGADQQFYEVQESGNYAVVVTGFNGCVEVSDPIFIQYTGLRILNSKGITIFPNPTLGDINIHGLSGHESISLYDSVGQLIWMLENSNKNEVDISNLNSGIYSLIIDSAADNLVTIVIVE